MAKKKNSSKKSGIFSALIRATSSVWRLISKIIGTFWCVKSNQAKSCDTLGFYNESDSCCRTHANCPFYIESKGKDYSFKWNGMHTLSHCECDAIVNHFKNFVFNVKSL